MTDASPFRARTAKAEHPARLADPAPFGEDLKDEPRLRPLGLDEFVGQTGVKEQLRIFLEAARRRGEALDHVLFHGPPGLGKTTLASILAHELGVEITHTSGPVIERPGDLAGLLTNLGPRGILFIDEIHRMSAVVEEYLYPALEDFTLDILLDRGPSARSLKLNLERFTLVGATTRAGLLSSPLRARFGVTLRLDYYGADDLASIVRRSAGILDVKISPDAAVELARRSGPARASAALTLGYSFVLRIEDLDYDLPPERIAQRPTARREDARLLVVDRATGSLQDSSITDLPRWLRAGDCLVLNETRV